MKTWIKHLNIWLIISLGNSWLNFKVLRKQIRAIITFLLMFSKNKNNWKVYNEFLFFLFKCFMPKTAVNERLQNLTLVNIFLCEKDIIFYLKHTFILNLCITYFTFKEKTFSFLLFISKVKFQVIFCMKIFILSFPIYFSTFEIALAL